MAINDLDLLAELQNRMELAQHQFTEMKKALLRLKEQIEFEKAKDPTPIFYHDKHVANLSKELEKNLKRKGLFPHILDHIQYFMEDTDQRQYSILEMERWNPPFMLKPDKKLTNVTLDVTTTPPTITTLVWCGQNIVDYEIKDIPNKQ